MTSKLLNISKKISYLINIFFIIYASNTYGEEILDAQILDEQVVETPTNILPQLECDTPPCDTNIDSLLEKLTNEYEKPQIQEITPIDIEKIPDDIFIIEPPVSETISEPNTAEIIVLNKITAKSKREIFTFGEVKFFGNLSIEVHKCEKNTDPFNSNNFILLTVSDNKIEEENILVYHGWLASSNLSIATIEHSVYEVIAVNCLINTP